MFESCNFCVKKKQIYSDLPYVVKLAIAYTQALALQEATTKHFFEVQC